ncbi:hypothetical protein BEWA_049780 [Theileria equi strain WA]|uniref:C-CAP/cofactor C-like domain-containing protein n=1 Tax=Theileria equi strain WA TaxID=1537102 RepID=L1LB06_THEEQ|nr:hypothetical protein BEWA_049780 [Theileria equi strain WA]EKX72511.1 hypothetical protein BEWA_049780 [Theileria equi strain WA]|eukprot:XP_004831963.1 hypothetical protein BEWA_049780 [Theileria equi strain WA]
MKYGYVHPTCKYYIKPKRGKSPRNEFKVYVHPLPAWEFNELFYYLGRINYKGTEQHGFRHITSCHTDVVVYYWSHDDANFCPLLIRLRKGTWWSYHEYYKSGGIGSNEWAKYSGLAKIVNDNAFKKVVTLKLDHIASGTQYAFDGTDSSSINSGFRITVTEQKNQPSGYNKYIHTLEKGGSMRIVCTKHKGKFINFKGSTLQTPYYHAYVYYAKTDGKHDRPLILELGHNTFYRLDGGNKWVHDKKIKSNDLSTYLDNLNGAHIIEISQKNGPYKCTSPNCDKYIQVQPTQENSHKYIKRRHYLKENSSTFSVSSFVGSSKKSQTGLSSPTDITELFVYFRDQSGTLLIFYESGRDKRCFKKVKGNDHEWTLADEDKLDPDDPSRILELLRKIEKETQESLERRGEVWNATGYANEELDLSELTSTQSCNVYDSHDVQIKLPTKMVSLSLVSCKNVRVDVKSLISGMELTSCTNVRVIVEKSLPSAAIDKCQQVGFWIPKSNADSIMFTSCKSGDMNVNVNKNENGNPEDDDWVELPIHEQFEHTIENFKMVTRPSSLYP